MAIYEGHFLDGNEEYVFLDIETTGLDKDKDEMVNVALLYTDMQLNIIRAKDYWFNPTNRLISISASAATGLTNSMVHQIAQGEVFTHIQEQLRHDLLDIKQNKQLFIHNVPFDAKFIDAQYNRWRDPINITLSNNITDTMVLARERRLDGKESISLDSLKNKYEIKDSDIMMYMDILSPLPLKRHTGLFDALLTREVLLRMKQ